MIVPNFVVFLKLLDRKFNGGSKNVFKSVIFLLQVGFTGDSLFDFPFKQCFCLTFLEFLVRNFRKQYGDGNVYRDGLKLGYREKFFFHYTTLKTIYFSMHCRENVPFPWKRTFKSKKVNVVRINHLNELCLMMVGYKTEFFLYSQHKFNNTFSDTKPRW